MDLYEPYKLFGQAADRVFKKYNSGEIHPYYEKWEKGGLPIMTNTLTTSSICETVERVHYVNGVISELFIQVRNNFKNELSSTVIIGSQCSQTFYSNGQLCTKTENGNHEVFTINGTKVK